METLAKFTMKAEELLPTDDGADDIILILYPVPAGVFVGMFAFMDKLPVEVELKVPILTALVNDPVESDNCAV